mmetsp:Transcript_1060/g.1644  ORF Transcript_1060/g.1644 Transcript_1060/m.1644 type:complete len:208 (-) Transcript_1060:616-1239(-)
MEPTANNGDNICMSFHLVNRCFLDCHCRSNHCPLVGGERTSLCTFTQDNVATPDLGRSRMGGPPTEPTVDRRPHLATTTQFHSPADTLLSIETNKTDVLGEFICLNKKFYIDNGSWAELFHSRVAQTSLVSIFAPSGPVPFLFYTDMPPKKVSQYYFTPSLGLLSRRMLPSSAAIILQLMPSLNSCEKKIGDMRRKGMSIVPLYELL